MSLASRSTCSEPRSTPSHYCRRLLATRSIIGAAIRPLKLTEQAMFRSERSETGQAWRLDLLTWANCDGLAVFYVGSPPDLLIVICRRPWEVPDGGCQDCGSSASCSLPESVPRWAKLRTGGLHDRFL